MGKKHDVGGEGGAPDEMAMLAELFQNAKVGEAMTHGALSIYPVFTPDGHEPNYILFEEALKKKSATISEVDASGNVPELLVVNDGDSNVLLLEGDVLIGAKQNRVVNVTVLVAAHSQFKLPVSCVERGRWNYISHNFSLGHSAPMELRCSKTSSVRKSVASHGRAMSDQMDVWNKVDACLDDMKAKSPTSSLDESYKSAKQKVDEFREKIRLPKDATGFIVAVDGKGILGMDLFGHARIAERCWDRLSESYMLESLRHLPEAKKAAHKHAEAFVRNVGEKVRLSWKTTGMGQEIEVDSGKLTGTGLVFENRLVHLAAFATE